MSSLFCQVGAQLVSLSLGRFSPALGQDRFVDDSGKPVRLACEKMAASVVFVHDVGQHGKLRHGECSSGERKTLAYLVSPDIPGNSRTANNQKRAFPVVGISGPARWIGEDRGSMLDASLHVSIDLCRGGGGSISEFEEGPNSRQAPARGRGRVAGEILEPAI
jgi:hypothetical protein